MKSTFLPLIGGLFLIGCDGVNPITGGGGDGGAVSDDSVSTLTGPSNPSASRPIKRVEKLNEGPSGAVTGNGFAEDFEYDPGTDTFSVDNLGFDGDNAYQRDSAVPSLGPFQVYESDLVYADDVTGVPIGQFMHRALYGVSTSGDTEFAIVRTGSYLGYGFGGFMFERNGSVVLPAPGTQALYSGDYAAIRDFNGAGGLEYATGDMELAIDLRDFDDGNAVQGVVFNRVIFDANGNDITQSVIDAINDEEDASLTSLPAIVFTVGPGVMDRNGELEGNVTSPAGNNEGGAFDVGSGKYYAVLSGDNEVVGIIVTESGDRRAPGVTVRETGGFILYRP